MQLQLLFSNWTKIAGVLLMGAALAWAIKLGVIISTNGEIINTGAAALCMKIGLLMFAVGSTGIGHRLSFNRTVLLRIIAIILSPVVVFGSFLLFGMITAPLFENSAVWYAQEESPLGLAVIVYIFVGYFLYKNHKPTIQ